MIRSLHYLNFNKFTYNTNFSINPNQFSYISLVLIDTIVVSHSVDKQNKNIYNLHSSKIYIHILSNNSNINQFLQKEKFDYVIEIYVNEIR